MKKHRYQMYICISTSPRGESSLQYAYCQCPIGLAKACSHIGGLLFALSNAKIAEGVKSCTSKPCQWNVPGGQVKPSGPMSTIRQSKPKLPHTMTVHGTTEDLENDPVTSFDPRHTKDRNFHLDQTLNHLRDLKDVFPNTGMAHLWNIPDHVPEACQEVSVIDEEEQMVVQMKNMVFADKNIPKVTIDQDFVEFIERSTRGQRSSEMWQKLHIGRLTSSLFGDVLHAGANPNSLIRQIVEGSSLNRYTTLPPAVQWGVDKERKARADYLTIKAAFNDQVRVEDTGLTLCATYSFLGASSDGRVIDGDSVGLLEIKCPYSIQGTRVSSKEISEILSLGHPNFCLESSEEGPRLKKSHKYFAQVQGEMAIMGLPWCDFVVWTDAPQNNICIDRVNFDAEFVNCMMPELVKFYVNCVAKNFYPKL